MTDRSFYYNWGRVHLLKISGKDAHDFLQRLSTQNFKKPYEVLNGAFLTGQAKFISLFTAWREDSSTYFFIEPCCFEKTFNYLNQMHFSEDLKIEKEICSVIEARGMGTAFNEKNIEAFNWGIEGRYLFNSEKEYQSISSTEYDSIRAQHGFPKPTIDLTEDTILIEVPQLEIFVDRNKGCYPGQEVIEKIYTYGRVAQKILRIQFGDLQALDMPLSLPLDLISETEEKIGVLTSLHQTDLGFLGLGRIKRRHYEQSSLCYVQAVKSSNGGTIV